MASFLFWDAQGIFFVNYLEHGKIMNNNYYNRLLGHLKAEITKKGPHLVKKKILLHQDNPPCHKSLKTITKMHELGFELLLLPPYSPDLASSDYHLFFKLKKILCGNRFGPDKEVIAKTESYFEGKDKLFYKSNIKKLKKDWNNCISAKGDYVDQYRDFFTHVL